MSKATVRILLLEASEADADRVASHLQRAGAPVSIDRVASQREYIDRLSGGGFDIILSEFEPPRAGVRTTLALAREAAPGIPFIYISNAPGEDLAVEALKEGAADYLLKPRMERLPAAVEQALAKGRDEAERRRGEDQLRLSVGELSHRVKNLLAMASSVARLTLKRSRTLEEFEAAFLGRLDALAEAHSLVFRSGGADMRRIIERAVAPFARGEQDFGLEGPPLRLPPKPALSLSLIFHELAANAVRHGALSSETGFVRIAWTIGDEGRRVHLRWKEEGGPLVHAPHGKGFGSHLIERSARHELDGRAMLDFAPAGLDCRLDFPIG